ncbi:MAG: hypothetical protein OEV42_04745 [Deltaproteobacteria bacterium]|nr:hypothetical protein [Deltaproteobacteria bacterium]
MPERNANNSRDLSKNSKKPSSALIIYLQTRHRPPFFPEADFFNSFLFSPGIIRDFLKCGYKQEATFSLKCISSHPPGSQAYQRYRGYASRLCGLCKIVLGSDKIKRTLLPVK